MSAPADGAAAPLQPTPAPAAPAPRVPLVSLGAPAAVCDGDTCALP
ncbi:hypothetical protein AB4Z18_08685 [Leifsonia sp. 2TAF2]